MPRLIAYVRVSALGSRTEAELNSHHDQEARIREYCSRYGFEVADVVVDLNQSGAKASRKQLRAIVERIHSGDVDGIVVWKLSRMSRMTPLDRSTLFHEIEEQGKGIVASVCEGHDWTTPQTRFIRDIFLAVDRYEWEEKAAELELQKRNAVSNGVHMCGFTPVGYDKATTKPRKLILNEDAEHIAEVFRLRAAGGSLMDGVRYLQEHLPLVWKTHKGKRERVAAIWRRQRVATLLRNRVYLGEARHAGDEIEFVKPDAHVAIVDVATFDIVQAMFLKEDKPRRLRGENNLLAGVVRCGSCEKVMDRHQIRQGRYAVYSCKSDGACSARASAMAHAIEPVVWQEVLERLGDWDIEAIPTSGERDRVAAELAVARAERESFASAEVLARLGQASWDRGLIDAEAKIAALIGALSELTPAAHGKRPSRKEVQRIVRGGKTSECNELISHMLTSVVVARAPRGTHITDRITLNWVDGTTSRPRKAEVEAGIAAA